MRLVVWNSSFWLLWTTFRPCSSSGRWKISTHSVCSARLLHPLSVPFPSLPLARKKSSRTPHRPGIVHDPRAAAVIPRVLQPVQHGAEPVTRPAPGRANPAAAGRAHPPRSGRRRRTPAAAPGTLRGIRRCSRRRRTARAATATRRFGAAVATRRRSCVVLVGSDVFSKVIWSNVFNERGIDHRLRPTR